jgi:uncharacterized cupin superfamily protein
MSYEALLHNRPRLSNQMITAGLCLCFAASSGATEAARVLYASGEVSATKPDGSSLKLTKGDAVAVGSTLVVGRGKLQLRFVDGALMSFKPNTRFEIQAYQFKSGDASDAKAETRLVEGGLRTLTGAIAKVNRNAYRMETQSGTIGIRGTQFSTDGQVTTLYEGAVIKTPDSGASSTRDQIIFAGFSSGGSGAGNPRSQNNLPTFNPSNNMPQSGPPMSQVFQDISPSNPDNITPPPPPPPPSPSPPPPRQPERSVVSESMTSSNEVSNQGRGR